MFDILSTGRGDEADVEPADVDDWLCEDDYFATGPSLTNDLAVDDVLERAAAVQRNINVAQAEQLALAACWADLHAQCRIRTAPPGGERLTRPGGAGTPEVAEFAAAELGAVIGVSKGSAAILMADALDLRHRLPQLWRRVQAGDIKVWIARKVAARTRCLSETAAASVDAAVAGIADTLPYGRLEKVLDAAILAADPAQASKNTATTATTRGVWMNRELQLGHQTMFGRADAPDMRAFDATLDVLARAMTVLGDTDTFDVRRAKALGVLADPSAALEMTRLADEALHASDSPTEGDDGGGADAGSDPRRGFDLGPAVLYVNLSQESVQRDRDGVARVRDIGPVLLEQVRAWLGHRHVTVKPVLDIAGLAAVDRYEVPDRMAEAIRQRTPADNFPYSSNLTLNGDNEHTIPYVPISEGGPPGQTTVENLSWMPRGNHRIKTHGGWTVSQPRSGIWIWRSPHHRYYLVDHTGTTSLGKL